MRAQEFYRYLGFVACRVGMKYYLGRHAMTLAVSFEDDLPGYARYNTADGNRFETLAELDAD